MSKKSRRRGPYEQIMGSSTLSGRQFMIGVVAESPKSDPEVWLTYQLVTDDGHPAEKYRVTVNVGPVNQLTEDDFAGEFMQRLCDLFAELLEPH